MHHFIISLLVFASLAIPAGAWLGWQLLRQNGRLLLRLEELETRLDELESGGNEPPPGLPIGTEAPAFELPDLEGRHRTLAEFRGWPLLLVFFNPACGFCRELLPKLASFHREGRAPRVPDIPPPQTDPGLVELGPPEEEQPRLLIVTTGDAEANRQLFAGHTVGSAVLLQKESEVAGAYQASGTPAGYLIDAEGKTASELAMGAEALLPLAAQPFSSRREEAPASLTPRSEGDRQPGDRSFLPSAAASEGNGRERRFGNRSLERSRLKRDGLKAGTPAPDFRLPRLDGRGDLGLAEFRGQRVLLVFSSPGCGPCLTLAPQLEKFHREHLELEMVMITKGEPKENRAKVKEFGLTFHVVLQQQWEISRRYAMFATPVAYLIDEQGVIARDVAVGTDAIVALLGGQDEPDEVRSRSGVPALG